MPVDAVEIKNIAENLLKEHPGTFSSEFDVNKRRVEELTDIRAHHTRNRIAGHLTRNKREELNE